MAKEKNSGFAVAARKVGKAWDDARNADPTNTFSTPNIDDGTYNCKVKSAKCGVIENGKNKGMPFVSIVFTVTDGEFEGTNLPVMHTLADDVKMSFLSKDLQRLGYETKDTSLADVEGMIDDLAETLPDVQVDVKNKYSKDANGNERHNVNVYVNSLIEADEGGEEAEEAEEPKKPARKADAPPKKSGKKQVEVVEDDEEPADEEAEEDDDEEAESIEIGDVVKYKPSGSRKAEDFQVTGVKNDELTLKRLSDKKVFKGVPVDQVEIVYDE